MKSTKAQKPGCGIAFGVGWVLFSLIFVAVGLWQVWRALEGRTWVEVPCVIERFEIRADRSTDPPFQPDLRFRYEFGGVERVSDRLWRDERGEEDYEKLAEVRERLLRGPEGRLPAGVEVAASCRVNPKDPSEAVLLDSSWRGLLFGLIFAAFGTGFVLVGIGIVMAARTTEKANRARSGSAKEETGGRVLALGFFGVFAVAGMAMLVGLVLPKARLWLEARSWRETPAEVVWSRVKSHDSDDGTTYSAEIFYRYEFAGVSHRSNRYNLIGGSSSGRSGKQEVVSRHPRGTPITCWVNPDKPWQAVVRREVGWAGLFALFPLPFLAVGLGGLWHGLRKKKDEGGAGGLGRDTSATRLRVDDSIQTTSVRFKRIGMFVGALFLAAFWNGIVSVFLWQVWKGWARGDPEWFLTIFMIPFVLIGIGLLINVPYQMLAIFSPIFEVALGEGALKPGSRMKVSWRRTGGGGDPQRLSLWLIGEEEATYRRGTSQSMAKSVFHKVALFETGSRLMMPHGQCELRIPEDAVPSFEGRHNQVRWLVRLVAEVPWRPDVRDDLKLEVRPFERGDLTGRSAIGGAHGA